MMIRRVFIKARLVFAIQPKTLNLPRPDIKLIEVSFYLLLFYRIKRSIISCLFFYQQTLFDVTILCPDYAPSRCVWCNGPYHTRRRCPKMNRLVAEGKQEKSNNPTTRPDVQYNNLRRNPINHAFHYYPKMPHEAYQNWNSFRYEPWSTPDPTMGPIQHYPSLNNQPITPRQYRPKAKSQGNESIACYKCGLPNHIARNCPHNQKNQQRQNNNK